jgi:hypothetical protein
MRTKLLALGTVFGFWSTVASAADETIADTARARVSGEACEVLEPQI